MGIEIRGVTRQFGAHPALDNVTLSIAGGELVALVGPSGSGKTTLLRLVAGLDEPDAGTILLDGTDATHRGIGERRVGFVFQNFALFRHLTVFDNVAFGLRVRPRRERPSRSETATRVHALLDRVQLGGMERRYPWQLSGGQRQRVAVARALAIEPRVLLMDEPFGALDTEVRQELRRWLRGLQRDLGITTVLVTHDQREALEIADRVALLHGGRLAQVDTPEAVYAHPATPFVARFFGDLNTLAAEIDGAEVRVGGYALPLAAGLSAPTGAVRLYVRPHDLIIERGDDARGFPARVREIAVVGPTAYVTLERPDTAEPLLVTLDVGQYRTVAPTVGEGVRVAVRVYLPFFEAAAAGAADADATGSPPPALPAYRDDAREALV